MPLVHLVVWTPSRPAFPTLPPSLDPSHIPLPHHHFAPAMLATLPSWILPKPTAHRSFESNSPLLFFIWPYSKWLCNLITSRRQPLDGYYLGTLLFLISLYLLITFNCAWTKFIAFIVNVCVFFMQNVCLTLLNFRVTFTPLTFCVSRDLKFSLNHNFKQLNSIGGNLILKVKWKIETGAIFHFQFYCGIC